MRRFLLCLAVLSLVFQSCTPDYGKKYEYRRHLVDYKNAITLEGDNAAMPKLEFLVFVGGFDTIAIKIKDKKPKLFRVQSEYRKKGFTDETVSFYKVYDDYNNMALSFLSKENAIYAYGSSDVINKIYKDFETALLLIKDNNVYIYPYDKEKDEKEKKNSIDFSKKRKTKNDYFR